MTYTTDCTLPTDVLDQIAAGGLDALLEAIRLLINAAMLQERQKMLGVGPYERSPERQAHANGFKDKTVQTRMAALTLAVPQVREGGFFPKSLEKGVRSERAQARRRRNVRPGRFTPQGRGDHRGVVRL